MGQHVVYEHLLRGSGALPGFADPRAATASLLCHIRSAMDGQPGVHLFVTHDSLLAAFVARLTGLIPGGDTWPGYLGAALLWERNGHLAAFYAGNELLVRTALA